MDHINFPTKAGPHDDLKYEIRYLVRQQWRLAIYAIALIIFTAAFFRAVHINGMAAREVQRNVHNASQ